MILFIATVFHESNIISCYVFGLWQQWATLSAPFWCLCQKLSQSLLYFNKTLLHRSAKRLSLVTGPGLNSSLPEAKNPGIFYGSAATFHLGGSSGILQDKVRILRALVLCSPSKHVFCCTLLTLQWACVNEWSLKLHCMKQVMSPTLWFHSYLTRLMAKTLLGVYTGLTMDFSGGSDGKASACNAGDLASVPGLRRPPGEGNGNPLQYSCLENPMDRGAW